MHLPGINRLFARRYTRKANFFKFSPLRSARNFAILTREALIGDSMIQSQITKPPDKIRPNVAGFPGLGGIFMPPWPVLSHRPARPLPRHRRATPGRARCPQRAAMPWQMQCGQGISRDDFKGCQAISDKGLRRCRSRIALILQRRRHSHPAPAPQPQVRH